MLLPALMLLLSAAAAPPLASPSTNAGGHRFGRLFISPMGEPFSAERGGDALADWFHQADRNHDGQITIDEMQQDAERFFAILDTNHDGEIDPDEITHYETVIAPDGPGLRLALAEGGDPGAGRPAGAPSGGGKFRHHGSWGGGRSAGGPQGRAQFGLLDLAEPVVSADSDFNRGVSLNEFKSAAAKRFSALDVDHRGLLTLDVLETLRPPEPRREKRDPDAPPDIDANADTSPG